MSPHVVFAASGDLGSVSQAGDCTTIDLAYESNADVLTDAEISARRDAQHLASLNQFERCIEQANGQAGGGGVGGAGCRGCFGRRQRYPDPRESRTFRSNR